MSAAGGVATARIRVSTVEYTLADGSNAATAWDQTCCALCSPWRNSTPTPSAAPSAGLQDGHTQGMNDLAQRLHDQGALRDEVTVDQAGHLLWLHTSFDAFDLLFTGRSLSTDTVATLLADAAEHALCRPA
ncbi:hypothetical protein ACQPYK_13850 [Streptosporangium sp. CA-135522]|uniref:hypothetical protein n=1 Tax=Streptosporangium sp. CA-135522 TaxID=3240072 RepID=UPI003D8CBB8B